ncbi:MAG: hypothetical protein C0501_30545 [Isosphaera sp.]|nr:hypothetical protein [Isosphaera sp.]
MPDYKCEFRTGWFDTPDAPPALADEVRRLVPTGAPGGPSRIGFSLDGGPPEWVTPTAPGSAFKLCDEIQFAFGELKDSGAAVVDLVFVAHAARPPAARPVVREGGLGVLDGLARFAGFVVWTLDPEDRPVSGQWAALTIRRAADND